MTNRNAVYRQHPQNVPPTGLAVDSSGGQVIDPTKNVADLVEAKSKSDSELRAMESMWTERLRALESQRSHDLREEHVKFNSATHEALEKSVEREREYAKEIGALQSVHLKELATKESNTRDALRAADREENNRRVAEAATAVTVLAKQTSELQVTLSSQVQQTAAAAEIRFTSVTNDFNKRITDVERAASEGKGKQAVADPQLDRLALGVEALTRLQDKGSGKSDGIGASWLVGVGAVGLVATVLSISSIFRANSAPVAAAPSTSSAPQVIYVPAPVQTTPPTAPPPTAASPPK